MLTGYFSAPFVDAFKDDRHHINMRGCRYTAPPLTSTGSVVCWIFPWIVYHIFQAKASTFHNLVGAFRRKADYKYDYCFRVFFMAKAMMTSIFLLFKCTSSARTGIIPAKCIFGLLARDHLWWCAESDWFICFSPLKATNKSNLGHSNQFFGLHFLWAKIGSRPVNRGIPDLFSRH